MPSLLKVVCLSENIYLNEIALNPGGPCPGAEDSGRCGIRLWQEDREVIKPLESLAILVLTWFVGVVILILVNVLIEHMHFKELLAYVI